MLKINEVPVQSAPSISRDCDVHSATSPLTVVFYPVKRYQLLSLQRNLF